LLYSARITTRGFEWWITLWVIESAKKLTNTAVGTAIDYGDISVGLICHMPGFFNGFFLTVFF